jgi:hypothetical protein
VSRPPHRIVLKILVASAAGPLWSAVTHATPCETARARRRNAPCRERTATACAQLADAHSAPRARATRLASPPPRATLCSPQGFAPKGFAPCERSAAGRAGM